MSWPTQHPPKSGESSCSKIHVARRGRAFVGVCPALRWLNPFFGADPRGALMHVTPRSIAP